MSSELDRLYELVEELEIAMMTTRRPDGHLQSRAMATHLCRHEPEARRGR